MSLASTALSQEAEHSTAGNENGLAIEAIHSEINTILFGRAVRAVRLNDGFGDIRRDPFVMSESHRIDAAATGY